MKFFILFALLIKCVVSDPADCCDFSDSTLCSWTNYGGWEWSGDATPDWRHDAPFDETGYMWGQDIDIGLMYSSIQNNVTSSTEFSFDYYISGSGGSMWFYFIKNGTSKYNTLAKVVSTNYEWNTVKLVCGEQCCGNSTCNGQIRIEGFITRASQDTGLLAFDNFQRDADCATPAAIRKH